MLTNLGQLSQRLALQIEKTSDFSACSGSLFLTRGNTLIFLLIPDE